jgi:hypothetical protein
MGSTTHSIEVNAPLRVVYNQWTQFEEFPRFMEGVAEVRQDGPNRLFWKAKIAGKDKQWEAEITEQVPDKRIAWVSIDGTRNAGEVNFESLELERTLITLTMDYEPEGLLEMAGDVLGIPAGQVEGDLNHFRDFIEQAGKETGSWRGEIGGEENLNSTAGAAIAPAPSDEIGAEGIQTEWPETFETVALPSSFIDESKRLPAERRLQEMPTESVEPFHPRENASGLVDKPNPPVALPTHSLDESNRLPPERPRQEILTESVEPFHPRENASGIVDKPIPPAAERFGEREADHDWAEVIAPSSEEIARRAYEIYLNRDRNQVPGHAEGDWLQAERELSGKSF